MSFNPNPGSREAGTKTFVMSSSLMAEKTKLPDLDYRALALVRLKKLAAKAPEGKYAALIAYLKERSGGGTQVDAAELDRRMRTWFEDMITRILQAPTDWDKDQVLNGKALMDYLSGIKAPEAMAPAQEMPPK
jgi:hypothetical protein